MKTLKNPETIIKKYGYEYHLVPVDRNEIFGLPNPCFMGYENMALKRVVKIKKEKK